MNPNWLTPGIIAGVVAGSAVLAFSSTVLVRIIATVFGIVDQPELAPNRKQPGQRVALLGGVAIWVSFVVVSYLFRDTLTAGYLPWKQLVGIWLASGLLVVNGVLDDIKNLKPLQQLILPMLATLIIVGSGIGIEYVSNPFGGVLNLEQWQWVVWEQNGLPYQLTLWADVFTMVWLMLAMYTTKLLDGLDGLVAGVGGIGALIIGCLSLTAVVAQPETGLLAFIFAGACFGFLVLNFHPAKIYLGEGGALLIGFVLGTLAIVSGSKIATALLILGLPMLDVLAVVMRRVFVEHTSPFRGDLLHLHFQLRNLGWGNRTIVLVYYAITIAFGASTLFLDDVFKIVVLGCLVCVGLGLVTYASLARRS